MERKTTGVIEPPWDEETVKLLNTTQKLPHFHPFTCGRRGEPGHWFEDGDVGILVATSGGWVCKTCDYTQDWAYEYMADPEWINLTGRFSW